MPCQQLHASAEQLETFQVEVMAERMETLAPHLWVLLNKLLSATGAGATKKSQAAVDTSSKTQDDSYWDSFDDIDLEGVIEALGDIPQT